MKRQGFFVALLLAGLLGPLGFYAKARAQMPEPVVRAVLFYSPTCPHCEYVIIEILPPLMKKYGNQLQIMGVDVTRQEGQALFMAALQKFTIEQAGVPFLVIDSIYLTGSQEIPEKLPGLIDAYLSRGGVDWPDIPGLPVVTSQSAAGGISSATAPAGSAPPGVTRIPVTVPQAIVPLKTQKPNWMDNFARDPAGNTLAVLVLAGMLASLGLAVNYLLRAPGRIPAVSSAWLVPILCLLGLGVAAYLTYVETMQVEAVCGPVGDCNTVQQSEYARLFGILPVGLLGMLGYAMILLLWFLRGFPALHIARFADQAILGMATLGIVLSIYLTFLEPFVIGATCAWCLASSVMMTTLFWLALPAATRSILQD